MASMAMPSGVNVWALNCLGASTSRMQGGHLALDMAVKVRLGEYCVQDRQLDLNLE